MAASKALAAATVSPMIRVRAWGIVPDTDTPARLAPRGVEQDTQPPINAAASMCPATLGWTWRAPNETTGIVVAASQHALAAVAHPVIAERIPKRAVS